MKAFDNISAIDAAGNLCAAIEPHAARLEDAADRMSKDGIGNSLSPPGHVHILRHMAATMRADAAVGKMPSIYYSADRFHATAEPKRFDAATSEILDALR